jgi:photosystem II stability/assembly factor-like uncharacterized protein
MLRLILGCFCLISASIAPVLAGTDAEVKPVNLGTAHEALYGLCLRDSRAVAVGQHGLVLESTDSGDTWTELDRFTEVALLDVDCGAITELYVGQGGELYRRHGGQLEALESGTDARLMSVSQSSDGNVAVAVGAFGAILISADFGKTWRLSTLDWFAVLDDYVEPHLYDVHVADDGQITVIGEFALVIQSRDGGVTWQKRHQGESSLFGLYIDTTGTGYAVGQEGAFLTTADAGETWAPVATPTNDILLSVSRSSDGDIVSSGIRKFIVSRDQGATWIEYDSPALTMGWYQGLELLSPVETANQAVLLAGHQASILKIELK